MVVFNCYVSLPEGKILNAYWKEQNKFYDNMALLNHKCKHMTTSHANQNKDPPKICHCRCAQTGDLTPGAKTSADRHVEQMCSPTPVS